MYVPWKSFFRQSWAPKKKVRPSHPFWYETLSKAIWATWVFIPSCSVYVGSSIIAYLGQSSFYTILFSLCWVVYYSLSGPCEFDQTWFAILYKVMGAKKKNRQSHPFWYRTLSKAIWASWVFISSCSVYVESSIIAYLGQLGFYTILFSLCWVVYYSRTGPCESCSVYVGTSIIAYLGQLGF